MNKPLDEWDKQIIADYKAGKLTALMDEAIKEIELYEAYRTLGVEHPEDYPGDFTEI